jgi:hypothetical protein
VNCPNCGTANLDTASICANCGRPLTAAASTTPPPPTGGQSYTPPPPPRSFSASSTPSGPQPPNYLVQSILVTLCCCLPLGVVAIVFAAQVNSKWAAGDYAGAADASNKAKMFCWIGFGIGIAIQIIWLMTGGLAMLQGFREGLNQ